ncbi:hypothetical protein [Sphingobacterium wenxiniae]|uniref:Nickel/cobalt transporter regulator n=1 Tax=Sphingobacterium wenxiniae TaxID=683125 RepID=A0A1I6UBD9_9SPHI|nr:hypothetical protein [Sphingobacterium wenxiniae]SFS98698.1 hypothetical protein SAMN05660206_108104 [Sphingobacterium wenxiniae]
MKRFLIGIIALALIAGTALEADAQGRGHGKHMRKEQVKHDRKLQKHAYKYAEKRDREYRKYYEKREKEYRKYVKNQHKRYRDHDKWYYGPRFYHRTEYVYFPEYRTYYDPYRRGYVYQRHNAWVFAPTMPSVMAGINIGGLQVQFMANLPL